MKGSEDSGKFKTSTTPEIQENNEYIPPEFRQELTMYFAQGVKQDPPSPTFFPEAALFFISYLGLTLAVLRS